MSDPVVTSEVFLPLPMQIAVVVPVKKTVSRY